jgi:hypothetical protein
VNELVELFGQDPDVIVRYDEDENKVSLFVEGTEKAMALGQLLPCEKEFGGAVLTIDVVPANSDEDPTDADLIKMAFKGNPVVEDIVDRELFAHEVTYVAFAKEVVQYYNDNLGDLWGNKSTLLEDIARDVFDGKNKDVYFCTSNQ